MTYRLEFLGNRGESFPYEGDEVLRDVRTAKTFGVLLFATMKATHPVIVRFEIKDGEGKLVAEGPDDATNSDQGDLGHQRRH